MSGEWWWHWSDWGYHGNLTITPCGRHLGDALDWDEYKNTPLPEIGLYSGIDLLMIVAVERSH